MAQRWKIKRGPGRFELMEALFAAKEIEFEIENLNEGRLELPYGIQGLRFNLTDLRRRESYFRGRGFLAYKEHYSPSSWSYINPVSLGSVSTLCFRGYYNLDGNTGWVEIDEQDPLPPGPIVI